MRKEPDVSGPSIDTTDEQARQAAFAAMRTEITLLDDLILHINNGLARLSGLPNDRGLNFLAMLLANRAFGSLWRAREDAVCGYPVQSLTLCRAALEDWGTLFHVERHPGTANLWLQDVLAEVEPCGRPPRFKDIWNGLENLGQKADEAYGVLSQFSHPRSGGLPWLYDWDRDKVRFHTGGHFDKRNLEVCLYFSTIVAQLFLERIAQLQFRVLGNAVSKWVESANEISGQAGAFVDRVHDETLASLQAAGLAAATNDAS
jgi:hypothetical protein